MVGKLKGASSVALLTCRGSQWQSAVSMVTSLNHEVRTVGWMTSHDWSNHSAENSFDYGKSSLGLRYKWKTGRTQSILRTNSGDSGGQVFHVRSCRVFSLSPHLRSPELYQQGRKGQKKWFWEWIRQKPRKKECEFCDRKLFLETVS